MTTTMTTTGTWRTRGEGQAVSLAEALLGDRKRAALERWLEKGFVSNVITFNTSGLAMRAAVGEDDEDADRAATFVLSFGLFGFSGGITNWLAVKMLFERWASSLTTSTAAASYRGSSSPFASRSRT